MAPRHNRSCLKAKLSVAEAKSFVARGMTKRVTKRLPKHSNHATGIGKGSEGGEGLTYMTAIRHWLSGAAWTQRLKNAMRENEAFQIM